MLQMCYRRPGVAADALFFPSNVNSAAKKRKKKNPTFNFPTFAITSYLLVTHANPIKNDLLTLPTDFPVPKCVFIDKCI